MSDQSSLKPEAPHGQKKPGKFSNFKNEQIIMLERLQRSITDPFLTSDDDFVSNLATPSYPFVNMSLNFFGHLP